MSYFPQNTAQQRTLLRSQLFQHGMAQLQNLDESTQNRLMTQILNKAYEIEGALADDEIAFFLQKGKDLGYE